MGLFLPHHSLTTTSLLQGHLSSPQQQNKEGPSARIRQRRRMALLLERNLQRRRKIHQRPKILQ